MHVPFLRRLGAACAAGLFALSSASAAPVSSEYFVSSITAPDSVAGDVVVIGEDVFVGVGSFGVGTQSVVRIDATDESSTVIADGFNSLAGFAYDPVGNRLLVGDNAGDLGGATTGDTVYAIPDPFASPGTPPSAGSLELLPKDSIPGIAGLLLDPSDASGDTLLITDASGSFPPEGELIELAIGAGSTALLQSGLEFAAGLATDGTTLFIGDSRVSGEGNVYSVPLASPGDPLTLLATLSGGIFDLELDPNGGLVATSGGSLVRIDPSDGSITTIATGFGFAAGLFAGAEALYVVDGFPSEGEADLLWKLTPVPEPGSGALLALGLAAASLLRRQSSRRAKRTGIATRP